MCALALGVTSVLLRYMGYDWLELLEGAGTHVHY